MKETTVETLGADVQMLVNAAQSERIVLTRGGRPVALIVGLDQRDAEDAAYETDPAFWSMIEQRRSEATVPLAEAIQRMS